MSNMLLVIFVAIVAFGPAVAGFIRMRRGGSKVLFVIGLVWAVLYFAIAIPGISPGRPGAQKNSCIANLKQLDGAKAQWASEKKPEASTVPQLSDLASFLKGGLMPLCPTGGTYTLGAVNEPPRCSHADKGHSLTPPR